MRCIGGAGIMLDEEVNWIGYDEIIWRGESIRAKKLASRTRHDIKEWELYAQEIDRTET